MMMWFSMSIAVINITFWLSPFKYYIDIGIIQSIGIELVGENFLNFSFSFTNKLIFTATTNSLFI